MVHRDGKYSIDRRAEAIAPLVCAAAALGNSSANTWLKLPACPNAEIVSKATTLLMVILGGEVEGDRLGFYRQVHGAQAAEWIREANRPMIIAGGGVHYSEAAESLRQLVDQTGIPVGETMAGKGCLPFNHPLN